MNRRAPVNVADLQTQLACRLCEGLLVNPTIIKECTHNFCRDCLFRYFSSKASDTDWNCPTCLVPVVCGRIKQQVRANDNLQEVIWRLFPSIYAAEMRARRDFYSSDNDALSETVAEFPKNGPYSLEEEHGRGERDLECDALKNNVTNELLRTCDRARKVFGHKPKLLTAQSACEVAHIRSMLANILECDQPQFIRILYNEKFRLNLSEALGDIGEVTCCTQPNKLHLQFSITAPNADFTDRNLHDSRVTGLPSRSLATSTSSVNARTSESNSNDSSFDAYEHN